MTTETDNRKRKRTRLGRCDICQSKDAIYTCPRCETVSCGLECVKKHKKDLDCDGVRVRTKFVPKDKLGEHTILSDYRLLEDVRRCVESAERYEEALETVQHPISASVPISKPSSAAKRKVSLGHANKPNKEIFKKNLKVAQPKEAESLTNRIKGKQRHLKKLRNITTEDGKTLNAAQSKTALLLAKSKRIQEKTLQQSKNTPNEIDKAVNNEPTSVIPDARDLSTSNTISNQNIYTEHENIKASLALKSVLHSDADTAPVEAAQPPMEIEGENDPPPATPTLQNDSPEDTVAASAQITPPDEEAVASVSDPKSKCKPDQTVMIKNRILRTIRQGGKRKEKIFETLQKVALVRGVVLTPLPEHFQRHWENTSFFFARENTIYWHAQLTFLNANCYTLSLSECSESLTLEALVQRCLKRSHNFHRKRKMSDALSTYRKLGTSKITVLMTAERLANSKRKFYVLDMKKTLRENFEGKCLIEFPQLCIALEDCYAVSNVHETVPQNFFEEPELPERGNDMEKVLKKKDVARKKRKGKTSKGRGLGTESDRESGELSESSEDNFLNTDSESEESEEELFQESEFRSIYKDLLHSFDSDVNKA